MSKRQPVPEEAVRRGDWMQTYTGRAFFPADPRPSDICLEDIAHGLSNVCRFGGQCVAFYSVAEHAILVSRALYEKSRSPTLALAGLHHDDSEAYLGDVTVGLKRLIGELYRPIETATMQAIAKALDLPQGFWTWPEVKAADTAILRDEREAVMSAPPRPWYHDGPGVGAVIRPLPPAAAASSFLFTDATLRALSVRDRLQAV
jgi:hypothetical protein